MRGVVGGEDRLNESRDRLLTQPHYRRRPSGANAHEPLKVSALDKQRAHELKALDPAQTALANFGHKGASSPHVRLQFRLERFLGGMIRTPQKLPELMQER